LSESSSDYYGEIIKNFYANNKNQILKDTKYYNYQIDKQDLMNENLSSNKYTDKESFDLNKNQKVIFHSNGIIEIDTYMYDDLNISEVSPELINKVESQNIQPKNIRYIMVSSARDLYDFFGDKMVRIKVHGEFGVEPGMTPIPYLNTHLTKYEFTDTLIISYNVYSWDEDSYQSPFFKEATLFAEGDFGVEINVSGIGIKLFRVSGGRAIDCDNMGSISHRNI